MKRRFFSGGGAKEAFVIEIRTTAPNEIVTFETYNNVNVTQYNYILDFGDGTTPLVVNNDRTPKSHTYVVAGTYEVSFTGLFIPNFTSGNIRTQLYDIKDWGRIPWGQAPRFQECNNLTVISAAAETWNGTNLGSAGTFGFAITRCVNVTVLDTTGWTMGAAENFQDSFRQTKMSVLDVSQFGMQDATTIARMFGSMVNLVSLNLTNWNITTKLTAANLLFQNCGALQSIGDVSGWDVSNVTTFSGAFVNTGNLDPAGLDSWQLTSCTTFGGNTGNGWSTATYDAFLINLAGQIPFATKFPIALAPAKYTTGGAAEAARTALINDGHSITDGGGV